MDPLSIIGIAATVSRAVFSVSQTLYSFIGATKNVDQSVKLLHAEVDGLNRVLDAITGTLKNPVVKSANAASPANKELLSSVEGSLEDCRRTVDLLGEILKNVSEKTEGRNPFRQPVRQIQMNLSEDNIKNFRAQVHTHNMNLQMALQTINLLISCLSPDRVIDNIGPRIELLTDMINKISISQSHGQVPADQDSRNTSLRTERLKRSAEAILSNASTIVGVRSTVWGGSERNFTTRSEYGEPLSGASRNRIERWIAEPTTDEDFLGNDELEFEVVEKYLERGLAEYSKDNFAEAEILLQRGVKRAGNISSKNKSLLPVREAGLKLAMIYFQQESSIDQRKSYFLLRKSVVRVILIQRTSLKPPIPWP